MFIIDRSYCTTYYWYIYLYMCGNGMNQLIYRDMQKVFIIVIFLLFKIFQKIISKLILVRFWFFFFLFSKTTISWLITGFVTKLIRRVPLVGKELFTLPEHLSSPPIFSGVCVTQSLVLCVCFVDQCLSFCTFSFGHCVVCSSLIYVFWLPLWYLQTLLKYNFIFFFQQNFIMYM
jgi:hypothetical protein